MSTMIIWNMINFIFSLKNCLLWTTAKYAQIVACHGTTSLPLFCPPLATSDPICLHSTSSASTLLQLQCVLAQLVQLHCAHSQTNCRSIPDPFGPGSHAKGHHLYTLSTFVLFA